MKITNKPATTTTMIITPTHPQMVGVFTVTLTFTFSAVACLPATLRVIMSSPATVLGGGGGGVIALVGGRGAQGVFGRNLRDQLDGAGDVTGSGREQHFVFARV